MTLKSKIKVFWKENRKFTTCHQSLKQSTLTFNDHIEFLPSSRQLLNRNTFPLFNNPKLKSSNYLSQKLLSKIEIDLQKQFKNQILFFFSELQVRLKNLRKNSFEIRQKIESLIENDDVDEMASDRNMYSLEEISLALESAESIFLNIKTKINEFDLLVDLPKPLKF